MKNKKKKVLIVGASAKEYALAKYISGSADIEKVFVAPGNIAVAEFAERVDIREDNASDLLEFVIKNEIDLTIVTSSNAVAADVVSDFRENSQVVFGPDAESAMFVSFRSIAKKFLYKLHIPTPRFGIFEKAQLALDYLNTSKYPLLITSDMDSENAIRAVCVNHSQAKSCINDLFAQCYDKVVIEEYVYGHPFTFYIVTDGYQALPFAVVGDYKFREDGDGGLYTLGMGAYLPDYKVSFEKIDYLMQEVIYPVINSGQNKSCPYTGFLGVECVLKFDNSIVVTGFTPFLKEHDAQAVLNSLDIDLYSLMVACSNGSFADDYEDIPLKNACSVSCVLYSRKAGSVISGLELLDESLEVGHFNTMKNEYMELLTNSGRTLVLTQSAATIARAKKLLYENAKEISFEGMKYRHDICSE